MVHIPRAMSPVRSVTSDRESSGVVTILIPVPSRGRVACVPYSIDRARAERAARAALTSSNPSRHRVDCDVPMSIERRGPGDNECV